MLSRSDVNEASPAVFQEYILIGGACIGLQLEPEIVGSTLDT